MPSISIAVLRYVAASTSASTIFMLISRMSFGSLVFIRILTFLAESLTWSASMSRHFTMWIRFWRYCEGKSCSVSSLRTDLRISSISSSLWNNCLISFSTSEVFPSAKLAIISFSSVTVDMALVISFWARNIVLFVGSFRNRSNQDICFTSLDKSDI